MKYSIRKISAIVIVVMILVMLPIVPKMKVFAAAGTITESESNDTPATAEVTYDDYTNYGTLNPTGDVDWWKITFSQSGIANFWLGNIPTGYNYDLRLFRYISGSYVMVAESTSNKNQETIRARVYAGETYYARVYSTGTVMPAQYQFRIKRHNLTHAKVFTYNYTALGDSLVTTNDKDKVLPHLWDMGYDAGHYNNNTATPVFNAMSNTSVFVFSGHGTAGIPGLKCYNTYLYTYPLSSADRGMSEFYSTSLTNCDLMLFVACQTAKTIGSYSNMVDMARTAGARTSIGWTTVITSDQVPGWLNTFFQNLHNRANLGTALTATNDWARRTFTNATAITSTYSGSSPLNSVILG